MIFAAFISQYPDECAKGLGSASALLLACGRKLLLACGRMWFLSVISPDACSAAPRGLWPHVDSESGILALLGCGSARSSGKRRFSWWVAASTCFRSRLASLGYTFQEVQVFLRHVVVHSGPPPVTEVAGMQIALFVAWQMPAFLCGARARAFQAIAFAELRLDALPADDAVVANARGVTIGLSRMIQRVLLELVVASVATPLATIKGSILGREADSLAGSAYGLTMTTARILQQFLIEFARCLAVATGFAEADLLTGGARAACVGVGLEAVAAFLCLARDARVALEATQEEVLRLVYAVFPLTC